MSTPQMTAEEYQKMLKAPKNKKSKFRNKPVNTDDGYFASTKERNRWKLLKLAKRAGKITALCKQVDFDLSGIVYRADFVYYDIEKRVFVVEDTKGFKTPEYKNKKTLMKTLLGIEIVES